MTRRCARDLHDLLFAYAEADATTVAHALISLRPTPHLAMLEGGTHVFTWCALDTLVVAHLLQCDVEVQSRAPLPGLRLPLAVAVWEGRLMVDDAYVLSFPQALDQDGRHFTEAFCPYANLFPSLAAYEGWAATQPRATTPLSVTEADAIAREYAADVLARGSSAGRCSSVA